MNPVIWNRVGLLAMIVVALAGCGGDTNGGSGGGATQTTNVGGVQLSYSGTAKPAVLNFESGYSVSSLAGVTLTNFSVQPAANLNATTLAFLAGKGGIATYQNGQTQTGVLSGSHVAFALAFDHVGHLYIADYPGVQEIAQITKAFYDGSSATAVYDSSYFLPTTMAISPNNSTIVGDEYPGIWTLTSSGTDLQVLDPLGSEPTVSPSGATIAYIRPGAETYTTPQIWTIPIGGGNPTQLTDDESSLYFPVYSPDGQLIYADEDDGASREIASFYAGGASPGGRYQLYTPVSGWASHAAISPDGRYLAYSYSPTYPPGLDPPPTTIDIEVFKI